jgi:hypothetical protein
LEIDVKAFVKNKDGTNFKTYSLLKLKLLFFKDFVSVQFLILFKLFTLTV